MEEIVITSFRGEHGFLSNFYKCEIRLYNKKFKSSEHAFMYCKSDQLGYKKSILAAETPSEAKKLGRKCKLRRDWESVKEEAMYQSVFAKFSQNDFLKKRLLDTGDQKLIEGNTWNDKTWGAVWDGNKWDGKNLLGKILMRVRKELQ